MNKNKSVTDINLDIDQSVSQAVLSVLLRSTGEPDTIEPVVTIVIDGKKTAPEVIRQEGAWAWYKTATSSGKHRIRIIAELAEGKAQWEGNESVWLHSNQDVQAERFIFEVADGMFDRPMPPEPYPSGTLKRITKLGESVIQIK